METEEELLGMLSAVKQQKAALDEQYKVVQAAINALAVERKKITEALAEVHNLPEQLLGPLKTAVATSAAKGVTQSLATEQEALSEAIGEAVRRLGTVKGYTVGVIIVAAMVGAMLGGLLVGGGMWYAISSGAIRQPEIMLDPGKVAAAIAEHLPRSRR